MQEMHLTLSEAIYQNPPRPLIRPPAPNSRADCHAREELPVGETTVSRESMGRVGLQRCYRPDLQAMPDSTEFGRCVVRQHAETHSYGRHQNSADQAIFKCGHGPFVRFYLKPGRQIQNHFRVS